MILLERFAYTPMGTFGRLRVDTWECYTVEEVWRDNQPNVSCIPNGMYSLRRGNFPKHGNTFEVMNVPGRFAILFHVANTIKDIEGCIGPGLGLGFIDGQWAVTQSRVAFNKFMELLADVEAETLKIENYRGGIL